MWAGFSEVEAVSGSNLRIAGTAGNDVLDFSNITLTGVYKIDAGLGNDTLFGSAGADRIAFSEGTDHLTGNAGADIFDLDRLSESKVGGLADTIMDFVQGVDKISLTEVDASTKASGNQAFKFIDTAAFSGVAGQLRVDHLSADTTSIYGDVNGDKVADFQINLATYQIFTATDFLL